VSIRSSLDNYIEGEGSQYHTELEGYAYFCSI